MKLYYTLYVALAAMTLAACQAKEDPRPAQNTEEVNGAETVVPPGQKILSINASGVETKTSYNGEVTFSWTPGDHISVLCNDGTTNVWKDLSTEGDGNPAIFSKLVDGDVELGTLGGKRIALYPASSSHQFNEAAGTLSYFLPASRDFRTHQESAIPMFAYGASADSYAFANMTGAIKFVFQDLPAGVSEVKLVFTSAREKLNGLFPLVGLSTDNASDVTWEIASAASAAERTLTFYANVDDTDGSVGFYIPFPDGTLSEGSSVLLVDADDESNVLFQHDYLKGIEVVKNRITVLATREYVDLQLAASKSFFETTAVLRNPERGYNNPNVFYYSSGNCPDVLSGPAESYNGNSLVFLLFYLEDYKDRDIPADVLAAIRNIFTQVRDRGKKAVVRFAYTDNTASPDAHVDRVEEHLAQLRLIFEENEDILYVVQAGFIGDCGEWNADKYVVNHIYHFNFYFEWQGPDTVNKDDYRDYARVVDALLTAVPESRQVALRTWHYKRFYFYTKELISSASVWDPIVSWEYTANSRLSFHNDGFASYVHEGGSFSHQRDRDMCTAQSAYMAIGGETYSLSGDYIATKSGGDHFYYRMDRVLGTLRNQHLSYLAELGAVNALDWMDDTQKEQLDKAMGYRLWLSEMELCHNGLSAEDPLTIKFTLNNSGAAPVIYKRPLSVVLLRGDTPTVLVENAGDIRDVPPVLSDGSAPGSRSFSRTITIPAGGIQSGDKLALWLPDAYPSLENRAAYAIRLANDPSEVTWLMSSTDISTATGGYNVFYTFP